MFCGNSEFVIYELNGTVYYFTPNFSFHDRIFTLSRKLTSSLSQVVQNNQQVWVNNGDHLNCYFVGWINRYRLSGKRNQIGKTKGKKKEKDLIKGLGLMKQEVPFSRSPFCFRKR